MAVPPSGRAGYRRSPVAVAGEPCLAGGLRRKRRWASRVRRGRDRRQQPGDRVDDAGGRYVDSAAVLVLSTASLRTAAELHPDGVWDPRRFRPNVLIDV